MQPGVITRATVAATSPLTVRETSTSSPVPARVASGVSYTPTTTAPQSRVLVAFVGDRYYILGGA